MRLWYQVQPRTRAFYIFKVNWSKYLRTGTLDFYVPDSYLIQ